jgi:hypothetical protein
MGCRGRVWRGLRQIDDKTGRSKDFEINALAATPWVFWVQACEIQSRRGLWTHLHGKAPWLNHFLTMMRARRGACGQLAR